METQGRDVPRSHHYRCADAGRRHALRGDLVRRGSDRRQPEVRVLQVPRQCIRLERGNWRGPLEELHHSRGAETGAEEQGGRPALGTLGCRSLVIADRGSQARCCLRHDRRCYSDPPASTSDAFVAFDLKTGKLLWSRQTTAGDAFTVDCGLPDAMRTNCPEAKGPDFDFGSSPILVELPNGRAALIAGQKSGVVHAVDPDRNGAILWQTPVGKGGALGGVQWGSAFDGRHVYVSLSDVQTEPAQAGTPGAQPTVFGMPMRLNPQAGGGLFALNPGTGQIVWKKPHPGCGEARLQPGTVSSGHRNSGSRVFRRARWPPPRIRERGRRHHLGHRYRAGLQNRERRARQRWLARRARASRGWREWSSSIRDTRSSAVCQAMSLLAFSIDGR